MLLKKILHKKRPRRREYTFSAFETMLEGKEYHENPVEITYNFFVVDGKLQVGAGFKDLRLPISETSHISRSIMVGSSVKRDLWFCPIYNPQTKTRQDKVFWSTSDGNLGYFDVLAMSNSAVLLETDFGAAPNGIAYTYNNVDAMLFSGPNGLYSFSVGQFATCQAVLPQFVDLCYSCDRLFGIVEGKKNKILYSENLDPSSWTVAESLFVLNDEQGACNKLFSIDDDLFVFRDYGITRVSKFGIGEELEVFNLFSHKSKIYAKSAVRCGDEIYFLARNGLFVLDGGKVKKILPILDNFLADIDNKFATATFDGTNYILACKMNFGDDQLVGCESGEYINNAMIFYNVFTKKVNVSRGVDVCSLCHVASGCVDKVFATFYGEHSTQIGMLENTGAVFGVALPKKWKTKPRNFGSPEKIKAIREVYLTAPKDCILFLRTDIDEQGFVISGKKDVQKIKTFVRGRAISFEFLGNVDAEICPPKIIFEEEK